MSNSLKLLEPTQLGPYPLKNRIVMAPLTRNRATAGNVAQPINFDGGSEVGYTDYPVLSAVA